MTDLPSLILHCGLESHNRRPLPQNQSSLPRLYPALRAIATMDVPRGIRKRLATRSASR